MSRLTCRQAICLGLLLVMPSLLQGCAPWGSSSLKRSAGCQITPPETLESDQETALKVGADLSALTAAPIKADFERTFKEKVTQTYRAIPDKFAACQMLLGTINCVSLQPNAKEIALRLTDYLTQSNACSSRSILPIATIEVSNEKPCIRESTGNEEVYHCQVYVHNTSDSSPLHIRHIKVADFQQLEGNAFKPWPDVVEEAFIEWPPDKPRVLPPGDRVSVPIGRIYPPDLQRRLGDHERFSGDPNIPQFRFKIWPWHKVMASHIEPGTHRFKLTAFFENAPPATAQLELQWPDTRGKGIASIVAEMKLRKL